MTPASSLPLGLKPCAKCGHDISDEDGGAIVWSGGGSAVYCHADDHSCYEDFEDDLPLLAELTE